MISDALFRLQVIDVALGEKQAILESLYNNSVLIPERLTLSKQISVYYITLMKMSNDFKKGLVKTYFKNP